jgi:hypothetical protein
VGFVKEKKTTEMAHEKDEDERKKKKHYGEKKIVIAFQTSALYMNSPSSLSRTVNFLFPTVFFISFRFVFLSLTILIHTCPTLLPPF